MPNGKGWLTCGDCIYHKIKRNDSYAFCEKHRRRLPDGETIHHDHTFCSEFLPTKSTSKVLNNTVLKDGDVAYYHAYKPESMFVISGFNRIIQLDGGKLYGYMYNKADDIYVICNLVL